MTSPENGLNAEMLQPYLCDTSSAWDLIIHIDEAHLIKKWGGSNFRKYWYELGRLRAFVKASTPFAAYSATLQPLAVNNVKKMLHMHPTDFLLINRGNFRKNLFWDIGHISGTNSALHEVTEYLYDMPESVESIPLTIIFVNSRDTGHRLYDLLHKHVPAQLKDQIRLQHSLYSDEYKEWNMHDVLQNAEGIFICTEIAAIVSSFIYR